MFTPIDIFFVLVILVFALMALAKGFVKELFGKASVIVGIGVAFMFYERLKWIRIDRLMPRGGGEYGESGEGERTRVKISPPTRKKPQPKPQPH